MSIFVQFMSIQFNSGPRLSNLCVSLVERMLSHNVITIPGHSERGVNNFDSVQSQPR
jgi:hypothetical protein